jgi:hypothetical protein
MLAKLTSWKKDLSLHDIKKTKSMNSKTLRAENKRIYLKKMLENKAPHGTSTQLLKQLQIHERLWVAYHEIKAMKLNALSYYLDAVREKRLKLIEWLESDDKSDLPDELICPTGLGMAPLGWMILADRGFAGDTNYFPNGLLSFISSQNLILYVFKSI